ncbi:hypothetical protein N665_0107s0019 [Sinapis alba]|nr:hypothetical protein N665_0107s0019 [Sinapis alba]
MPFGLKKTGSTYQRLVNMMFAEKIGQTIEIYIDDMLVKSLEAEEHISHLHQAFSTLRKYIMKLNPEKYSFGVSYGNLLGYIVTHRGIEANLEKIRAIHVIPSPRRVKEVHKLIGRMSTLSRFISRLSNKSHSFFEALKNPKDFQWSNKGETSVTELKSYLTMSPLLSKLLDREILLLYMAVSEQAVSAVLVREEENKQLPVYYAGNSKAGPYFQAYQIMVITSLSIKIVLHKPKVYGHLAKWAVDLREYDLVFKHVTVIKSQVLEDFMAEFSPAMLPALEQEMNI